MRFTFNGIDYSLRFHHGPVRTKVKDGSRMVEVHTESTECYLEGRVADKWSTLWRSITRKHPCDGLPYNKDKGRRIALARVLKDYNKAFRSAAWAAYLGRVPKE